MWLHHRCRRRTLWELQESDRRKYSTLYFTLNFMKPIFIDAPKAWTDEQNNAWVYCPNCWSYQWTTWGLNVSSEWRKCAPSCPPLMQDWKKLLDNWGGREYPICYSYGHLREQSDVIGWLESLGYTQITEDGVPGVGMNQPHLPWDMMTPEVFPKNTPINATMRQQNSHNIFGPVRDLLKFASQYHPNYLEIVGIENGPKGPIKKTYFLHYTGEKVKNVTATTQKNTLLALVARLFR